jgi:hypothetical protein
MGGLLCELTFPSYEPTDLAGAFERLRVDLRRRVGAGNRLDQLIVASNVMERFFMTGASVEDRAALHTWYRSIIEPRPMNDVLEVNRGSPISSLSGPTADGETGPNVAAAQPVTAEAGNQGPARVAPAPAAAQAGVAAAPAVA